MMIYRSVANVVDDLLCPAAPHGDGAIGRAKWTDVLNARGERVQNYQLRARVMTYPGKDAEYVIEESEICDPEFKPGWHNVKPFDAKREAIAGFWVRYEELERVFAQREQEAAKS